MKQVVVYARVSTDMQARDGVSLDAQVDKVRKWADLNEGTIIGTFVDEGISGTKGTDKREGLDKAVQMAVKEKAVLVVYSLSRLSRSTTLTLKLADTLEKGGADLVSLSEQIDTTSSAGKMVFRLMAVLNEFERDQIAERTSSSLQFLKAQRKAYSLHAEWGWKKDGQGNIVEDEREQEVIRTVADLRREGKTLCGIVDILDQRGIRNRVGRKITYTTVRHILAASQKEVA